MIIFIKTFLTNFLVFYFILYDFLETSENFSIHRLYLYIYLLFLFFNFMKSKNSSFKKLDIDIIFKFFIFLIKTPNFLLNYLLNIFKKLYLYIFHFKFRYFKNTLKILFKKYLSGFFLIWKPLFKKTSYFGYYRSNRSKWIK